MKYQVRVKGDDGKEYLISCKALREALDIDSRIDFTIERMLKIENQIVHSLEPKAEQEILALIKKNPNIRTGKLTDYFIVANRFMHLAFWHAWDKLQRSGLVIGTSHGQGHHRTWNIKEV